MYRNYVENKNENNGPCKWTTCRFDMYLGDISTTKESDEICRSLKMFAMWTAYKAEPSPSNVQVDAIMQEFACNGYSCDEMKYQNCNYEVSTFSDENMGGDLWKMVPSHAQECNRKSLKKNHFNSIKSETNYPVKHCVFCDNNNEPYAVVKSHAVRDAFGRVLCPKLRTYICPKCKASGDDAHTLKYCPQKTIVTMDDTIKMQSYRLAKYPQVKQQMKISKREIKKQTALDAYSF